MEFTLSNNIIKNSKCFGQIYYEGDISKLNVDYLCIIEGYTINVDKKLIINNDKFFDEDIEGLFNYIFYSLKENILTIKNDELGKLPLFFYIKGNIFIISNNFWHIIKNLSLNQINIDKNKYKQFLYFGGIIDDRSTYFDNILTLPPATIFQYNFTTKDYTFSKYYELKFSPDKNITLPIAVEKADKSINTFINSLYKKHTDSVFGLGNSGGLDSRLIGIYAKENNLKVSSFYIGNPKPNGFLYSLEYLNSKALVDYYNFNHNYAPVDCIGEEFINRLLLDIRNSPFGAPQIYKNPYKSIPDFDYLLVGQPGQFVGGGIPSNIDKISYENLLLNLFYFSSQKKSFIIKRNIDRIYEILNNINLRYCSKKDSSIVKYLDTKSYIDYFFTKDEEQDYVKIIQDFIDKNNNKDIFNLWLNFHLNIFARYEYCGGWESISRTRKAIYFYTLLLKDALKWPYNIFSNRKILKALLFEKEPYLFNLGDSNKRKLNFKSFNNYSNRNYLENIYNYINLKIHNSENPLVKNSRKNNLKICINILRKENPIFFSVFDHNYLDYLEIKSLHIFDFILSLTKTKLIMDFIYFNKFSVLLEKKEWRIV